MSRSHPVHEAGLAVKCEAVDARFPVYAVIARIAVDRRYKAMIADIIFIRLRDIQDRMMSRPENAGLRILRQYRPLIGDRPVKAV